MEKINFVAKVKQISEIERSTRKGNIRVVQVVLRAAGKRHSVVLTLEPAECDFCVDDEVSVVICPSILEAEKNV